MTVVEPDKDDPSRNSFSSNSDHEDPETEYLPITIEETVKPVTTESVEFVPLDEDAKKVVSKTPFCTGSLTAKEYTIIPDRKDSSSSEDEDTFTEIKPTELEIPLEEVKNEVPTEKEERFPVGEEPEDVLVESVSVNSSTTDPLNVIEYTTIPEKKTSLSSSEPESLEKGPSPLHFATEEIVSPSTMQSVESVPVFEVQTDVGDVSDSSKIEVVPESITEPASVLEPSKTEERKSSSSSSLSTDDEPKILDEKDERYHTVFQPSKDTSASEDEGEDSEPEEVLTSRTVTSVNYIDMTTDPVTVSIDLPKKLFEDALNE